MPETVKHRYYIWDALFISFAIAYAILAYEGISAISGQGTILDSDLQTYAQGMAGEKFPHLFTLDPVLRNASAANSIPNLQRMAASFFLENNNFGLGLLKAGAWAIFIFYAGWYILGRFVFKKPALAAILSLCMGVTIWIGWGTFWGITHSDALPRVFFATFMPFLLLVAIAAVTRPCLRPVAMLLAGLAMWLHGVSALNCGAMFFTAFAFIKPEGKSILWHFGNLACCLACFFIPVLVFLWPSLGQSRQFLPEELDFFKDYFSTRWWKDYGQFGSRVFAFLNPASAPAIILFCGIASWFAIRGRCAGLLRSLWKMCPFFMLALVIVSIFSWLETRYAPQFGRLPMGHELVRGLRFVIPLSWLMICGAVACFLKPLLWRMILCAGIAGLALFTVDRQYVAAQYALGQSIGIRLPHSALAEKEKASADSIAALMLEVARIVPPGEAVFSDEEIMAVRYKAFRPLAHTFKDGYVFFYNKDLEQSRRWLEYEKIIRNSPDGYLEAWLKSGAPWLLTRKTGDKPVIEKYGKIVLSFDGWILAHRQKHAEKAADVSPHAALSE